MKKALVTAIGSFASDIVIKTLKEEGIYVIGCDIYPKEWVAQSLDTDGFYQAPYAADKEETDCKMFDLGYITVTPVRVLCTDEGSVARVRENGWKI